MIAVERHWRSESIDLLHSASQAKQKPGYACAVSKPMRTGSAACALTLALAVGLSACSPAKSVDLLDGSREIGVDICDPASGPFSLGIDNPYLPYLPGQRSVLEGPDGSRTGRVQITVLDETEVVAGVTTRVVEEREWIDDSLAEVSRNFVVQALDGTVCYYGEEVDVYSNGEVVGHGGAWRAGEKEHHPGILMPGKPKPGFFYKQEVAPGVAEDNSVIISIGDPFSVPAGDFDDTLETIDIDPLSGGRDPKRYARGVGLILDERLVLISFDQ